MVELILRIYKSVAVALILTKVAYVAPAVEGSLAGRHLAQPSCGLDEYNVIGTSFIFFFKACGDDSHSHVAG
jgi:hypothetical protein